MDRDGLGADEQLLADLAVGATLGDDDMTTTPAGDAGVGGGDADGTDGGDSDGTDGDATDGTDGDTGDADGTDGDSTDTTDGDAS